MNQDKESIYFLILIQQNTYAWGENGYKYCYAIDGIIFNFYNKII